MKQNDRPLEYRLGSVVFYDLTISVDERVLIPRVESELLVELALKRIDKGSVLDLCAGSGCLGLAIKKERPSCQVVLSDISLDAISVMKENARANRLEVEIVQGDFLKSVQGRVFDYVICNPPYISEEEYETLQSSVKDHEPKISLVGGKTGLEFYERAAKEMPLYLKNAGWAFFEIGYNQGPLVMEIFSSPEWVNQEVKKDYAGHDRFFIVQKGL